VYPEPAEVADSMEVQLVSEDRVGYLEVVVVELIEAAAVLWAMAVVQARLLTQIIYQSPRVCLIQ